VTFDLTVTYDNGYGIPTVHLDAAPDTTVGS
jgi:hypothetical protein